MKQLEKSLNLKYGTIQILCFAAMCSLFGPTSSIFLSAKGFSTSVIGTALASVSALGVILQPLVATFADKHQEIKLQTIISVFMIVSCGLALVAYALKTASVVLLASFVGMLVMLTAVMPLLSSLAFGFQKYGIKINFGLARGLGSAAYAISSYVVLSIAEKMGANMLALVYVVFNIGFIIAVRSFDLPKDYDKHVITEETEVVEEQLSFIEFLKKYKTFMLFILGTVFVFFTHTIIENFMYQIVSSIGGTESTVGTVVFIAAIVELPAMASFEKIQEKLGGCGKVLMVSAIAFVIKHAITYFATNVYMVYFAAFFQILGYALFLPASVYLANKVCDDKDRNKAQSMVTVGSTASGIIANLCGGILIQNLGVKSALLLGVIVSVLGFIVVSISVKALKE